MNDFENYLYHRREHTMSYQPAIPSVKSYLKISQSNRLTLNSALIIHNIKICILL